MQLKKCEQAARDEVHVAVAPAADMSGVETRERIGALEDLAEQIWTCTGKKQRRSFLDEATAELQWHQRPSHEHQQVYQQRVRRHLSEVQQEVHAQQIASGEEFDRLRHELSQSPAEGSHYQNFCNDEQIWCVRQFQQKISSCDENVIT